MSRGRATHVRLQRQLEIALDERKPCRVRTKAARYCACLGEKLALITRPKTCTWCHCRKPLERHHFSYLEPLNVVFLCRSCHDVADAMLRVEDASQAAQAVA